MKKFIKALLLVAACAVFAVVGTTQVIKNSSVDMEVTYAHGTFVMAVDSDGWYWEIPTTKEHSRGDAIKVIWIHGDIAIKGE